jgi:tetratricopeptide (TPR) repeat protein
VAGDDPGVLVNAAHALAYFGEDIGATIALVDRALALNPNSARGWHPMLISGASSARQIPEALRLLERAIALDPRYGPALGYAAICCFRLVVVDEAREGDLPAYDLYLRAYAMGLSMATVEFPAHACTLPPIPQATAELGLSAAAPSTAEIAASASWPSHHKV